MENKSGELPLLLSVLQPRLKCHLHQTFLHPQRVVWALYCCALPGGPQSPLVCMQEPTVKHLDDCLVVQMLGWHHTSIETCYVYRLLLLSFLFIYFLHFFHCSGTGARTMEEMMEGPHQTLHQYWVVNRWSFHFSYATGEKGQHQYQGTWKSVSTKE